MADLKPNEIKPQLSPNRGLKVKENSIETDLYERVGSPPPKEIEIQEPDRSAPKMVTNGGGIFGYDAGSISSNPLKDPAFIGTHLRVLAAVATNKLSGHITYGDPARQQDGTAATNIPKSKLKNPNPAAKGIEYSEFEYWSSKHNQNREPYGEKGIVYDIPTSKWIAGVKVIDSLTMTSPSYTIVDERGETVEYDGGVIEIQNIMMNVSQKKNIVKTKIAGRDGSVHQYINLDDYVVECWGHILGYEDLSSNARYGDVVAAGGGFVQGERPEVAIREFMNFMERPTQVSIGCDFLNIVGFERAIIADFRLTQQVGKLDNQAFRFKMWSDKPFEIFVEDRA